MDELSDVCSQIVLKCKKLDRSGEPDIVWSVNKLARAVTKWTRALWQTLGSFDLLLSSHEWSHTILACEKPGYSIVDWDCSKTQLLQETLKILNQLGPNNADWDCLKTLTSQETLKIQNPLLEEHCAFLEVEHSYLQVGCVRSKLQLHTVPLNPRLYLQLQAFAWTVSPLSISGIWLSKYCVHSKNFPIRRDPWRDETQRKHANTKTKKHFNRDDVELFHVGHVICHKEKLGGHLEGGRTINDFLPFFYYNEFSLTGNGDSLVSDGRCKHFLARCSGCNALCIVSKAVIFTSACRVSHLAWSRTILVAARHSDLFFPALSLQQDQSLSTATRTLVWQFCRTEPAHSSGRAREDLFWCSQILSSCVAT